MRLFHPVNSLFVSWNMWLILLSKIRLFFNLVKHPLKFFLNYKDSKSVLFLTIFYGCWVFSNFAIFHKLKVAKLSRETCCHLVSETGSWFPLINHAKFAVPFFKYIWRKISIFFSFLTSDKTDEAEFWHFNLLLFQLIDYCKHRHQI